MRLGGGGRNDYSDNILTKRPADGRKRIEPDTARSRPGRAVIVLSKQKRYHYNLFTTTIGLGYLKPRPGSFKTHYEIVTCWKIFSDFFPKVVWCINSFRWLWENTLFFFKYLNVPTVELFTPEVVGNTTLFLFCIFASFTSTWDRLFLPFAPARIAAIHLFYHMSLLLLFHPFPWQYRHCFSPRHAYKPPRSILSRFPESNR